MKKIRIFAITLLMLLLSNVSYGQLYVDNFYENKSEHLVYSEVAEFDSLSADQIMTIVKHWAGINLVSETKNQLVYSYIDESFFVKTFISKQSVWWYIKLVIQVKDNKIRLLFYDDGNSFLSGYYGGTSQNIYMAAPTQPRTYKFDNLFNKDGICRKMYNDGLVSFKNSCELSSQRLLIYIKDKEAEEDTDDTIDNSDW